MLNNQNNNCVAVVLTAGDGKRMNSTVPKVMHLVNGVPMIGRIVSSLESVPEINKIVIVVSPKHTLVQEYLGERAEYVVQQEQKGTGHAVLCTESVVTGVAPSVMVVNGDLPCLHAESLQRLLQEHSSPVTMMTTVVSSYTDWQAPFLMYGRIIRDEQGNVKEIIEYKDASEEQKNILEVNSGLYCFQSNWLFEQLRKLKPENVQGEYYLTDVVKMALEQGEKVLSVSLDPKEAIGVTTQEDLKMIESLNT